MFCLCTLAVVALTLFLVLDSLLRFFKVGGYSSKFVFVTGCDTGFGRELAIRLDKMGFPVFAGCLTEDGRRDLEETCSSRLVTLPLNVADNSSIQEALQTVKQKLPHENSLWAVVNNAGVPGRLSVMEMLLPEDYLQACGINLFGPIEVSRLFMPLLRKSHGRLVLMTSVMGRCPAVSSPYSVSKFGIEAFGDVCRREVSRFGVKVCMIEPGFFKTNIVNIKRDVNVLTATYNRCSQEVKEAYGTDYLSNTTTLITNIPGISSPQTYKVIDAYVSAITSVYPRTRYVVGYDAKFVFAPLSFMPACFVDWFLSRQQHQMLKKRQ